MQWARIHSIILNWPGDTLPPTFDISADENGRAEVELAWDPQALLAPATYQPNPLRYYSSETVFNETLTTSNGTSRTVSVPAQNIQLNGNRASWTMPQPLWDAYVEETLKTLNSPPNTTFSRNLYYRVRVTAPGASQALIWPPDNWLSSSFASAAPHIGILRMSASPFAQVIPDAAAVGAMGGFPGFPTYWGDVLMAYWRYLPANDPYRQVLISLFAHEAFQSAGLPTRVALLKLWLFAGKQAGVHLIQLLDRNTVVGSNVVMPIISKTDLRGGKTLVENLLALLSIDPHPDLVGVISKEQLLDSVITEILDPNGQVNQGAAGTCSPTSLQTLLITINPAEYARLQVGWLSSAGRATLANGSVADVPTGILRIANYANVAGSPFLVRTFSELAFQASILKFAQAGNFPALTGNPQSINQIFQATITGGLASNETKRALDALFNVNFSLHYINLPAASTDPGWLSAQRAIRDGFVQDLTGRQQQMILATFWGQPYQNGHAVLAVRRDGGRIIFKNPQYAGSHPFPGTTAGGLDTNPPRRYEDPSQSLESITEADLATWIKGYWVPDTALI